MSIVFQEGEVRGTGTVAGKVYADYARAAGHWCITFSVLAVILINQVVASFSDYFISYWVNLAEVNVSIIFDETSDC